MSYRVSLHNCLCHNRGQFNSRHYTQSVQLAVCDYSQPVRRAAHHIVPVTTSKALPLTVCQSQSLTCRNWSRLHSPSRVSNSQSVRLAVQHSCLRYKVEHFTSHHQNQSVRLGAHVDCQDKSLQSIHSTRCEGRISMSNHGSDDDVDAEYEQDEEASDEADNDDNEDSYVGSSLAQTQQRSTRTSNVPPPTSPQRDLYSYAANMTDRQRREQDERNFARAVGRERRSEGIADGKRRIRFDARGNLQYSDDPERSEWREYNTSYSTLTTSNTSLEPAVFHHWIRRELAEASNRRGSYGRPPSFSTISA